MQATFSRRTLIVVAVAIVAIGEVFSARAFAQQSQQQPDGQPARPPQDAVLADNSVVEANVAYGEDELERLDVYAPRGASRAPVVVFVHGGEWTRGDKAAVSFKPKFFNQNGIVFVSINYRLSPAATHPAHVSDVAAAIRWVHEHCGRFGGDPKKIVLMGHSAGCHLVTLVAPVDLAARRTIRKSLKPAL